MSIEHLGKGKSPVLTSRDKAFIDLILSGIGRVDALKQIYPEKVEGRTNKQIYKSAQDIMNKKKCKEYKEMRERQMEEALEKEMKKKAKELVEGVMTEEELMLHYSNIARDEEQATRDRLKAMDSLSKYLFQLDKKSIDVQGELQQVIIVDDFEDDPEGEE